MDARAGDIVLPTHTSQDVRSGFMNVPGRHSAQLLAAAKGATVPVGHTSQLHDVVFENVPGVHAVQVVARAALTEPGEHGRHTDEPGDAAAVPG